MQTMNMPKCEKCHGSFRVDHLGVCANCSTPEPRAYGWPRETWLAKRLLRVRAERYQAEIRQLAQERG